MTRMQLSRVRGAPLPDNALRCDAGTEFANPFRVMGTVDHMGSQWWVEHINGRHWPCTGRLHAHGLAVELHKAWIEAPQQQAFRDRVREALHGRVPACWCGLDTPCHGDTLAAIASTAMEGQLV